ncbi:hypothetical protein IMG5_005540 [Ichthyophthirius multifiliis]|uniref:Uncharacterized protein n=1 Tax=Ichthyophthirius multifiliis TaxID=5932 RepID=G0QJI1_ICHMU|nr:hypothetical protein IMG5_005540 [Ichthyophthirius multifiliis]EGR34632.1 hypothetical protein IMG5_005540 [Ichthyophthirius multifiliis]|eukprot:XP_004039936.1 hypothetical protein IMG5_005540 [Ichthyophthirius multifiliis]
MVRPDKLPEGTNFYCFQQGIKPMWEDPANQGGGRYQMRIKIEYANKFWEDLLLGLIGEECEFGNYINGVTLQVKDNQHIVIQIWVKNISQDEKINFKLREFFILILNLQENSPIEYRDFPKK